jgi:hypothetical protein
MTDASDDRADEAVMLRRRLTRIFQATAGAANPGGWWVGDVAGERQVKDNLAAGRLSWQAAHGFARNGIAALEAGNIDMARDYAWEATEHFISAVLTRVRPSELAVLNKPAARRGRPVKK